MSYREIIGMGLIAGLTMRDMRHMEPGFVMDMYMIRADYDTRMNYGKALRKIAAGAGRREA